MHRKVIGLGALRYRSLYSPEQDYGRHWCISASYHAEILQVPHHGSQTSTLPTFVQRVAPHVGIISLGAGNPYGHPHPRVLQVLVQQQIEVFRTDYHGAITITSNGTQYQVIPFRPYRPTKMRTED